MVYKVEINVFHKNTDTLALAVLKVENWISILLYVYSSNLIQQVFHSYFNIIYVSIVSV